MKKLLAFASATAAVLVLWACSSDDNGSSTTTQDSGLPPPSNNEAGGQPQDDASSDTGTKDSAPADAGFDANSINAPEVTITYAADCPAFTKCDSDPTGTWKTTGGCLSSSIFDGAKQNCPNLQESNVVIKAKGIVDFTATTVSRQADVKLSAHVQVPKACFMNQLSCTLVAGVLTSSAAGDIFDTASCTDDGDNCQCDVSKELVDNSASTYTKDGTGTITAGKDTYDYCVADGVLTYQKTTNGTKEPVTVTSAP